MTTSEPTTEIVEEITSQSTTRDIIVVLKMIVQYLESFTMDKLSRDVMSAAADRLESQEREIEQLKKANQFGGKMIDKQEREIERFRAFHERYAEQTSKKYVNDICALTARAEQAERERDAAVNALTLYEDALFDECDKSYQSGFVDGFQSREEIDDED